jgi:hypothetical protein
MRLGHLCALSASSHILIPYYREVMSDPSQVGRSDHCLEHTQFPRFNHMSFIKPNCNGIFKYLLRNQTKQMSLYPHRQNTSEKTIHFNSQSNIIQRTIKEKYLVVNVLWIADARDRTTHGHASAISTNLRVPVSRADFYSNTRLTVPLILELSASCRRSVPSCST